MTSNGMRATWLKGPRVAKEKLKGKNGGTIFEQDVVKLWTPKAVAA